FSRLFHRHVGRGVWGEAERVPPTREYRRVSARGRPRAGAHADRGHARPGRERAPPRTRSCPRRPCPRRRAASTLSAPAPPTTRDHSSAFVSPRAKRGVWGEAERVPPSGEAAGGLPT